MRDLFRFAASLIAIRFPRAKFDHRAKTLVDSPLATGTGSGRTAEAVSAGDDLTAV